MELQVLEIKGQRVLTTAQLAESYGTTRQIISNNYTRNKNRYIIGKHIIPLEGQELKEFKASHQFDDTLKYAKNIYLWTEKGALLQAKSLNTDKAWEVYEYLVDYYFTSKPINNTDVKTQSYTIPNMDNPVEIFKILTKLADKSGYKIKLKPIKSAKSIMRNNIIVLQNSLSLIEINYELAFELFHAIVNYDKGNMIDTKTYSYYNSQGERAAAMMINVLNETVNAI